MKFSIYILSFLIITCGTASAQSFSWTDNASSAGFEIANKTAIDASGNVYTAGSYNGDLSGKYGTNFSAANHYGGLDGYVAKYNSAGTFQWAFHIGGALDDEILDVTIGDDGFLYITGYFMSADFEPEGTGGNTQGGIASNGGKDIFLAKYDLNGVFQWYEVGGGTGDDEGKAIKVSNNAAYVTGYYFDTASFDNVSMNTNIGNEDMFIAKISNLRWFGPVGTRCRFGRRNQIRYWV